MPRQQKNGMADAMLFFFPNENRFAGFRWRLKQENSPPDAVSAENNK